MKHRKAKVICSWSQVATATGYKVFWGTTSRSYLYSINVGNTLNHTVTGLQGGKAYYFSGKSYNAKGDSVFGNEVKHVA